MGSCRLFSCCSRTPESISLFSLSAQSTNLARWTYARVLALNTRGHVFKRWSMSSLLFPLSVLRTMEPMSNLLGLEINSSKGPKKHPSDHAIEHFKVGVANILHNGINQVQTRQLLLGRCLPLVSSREIASVSKDAYLFQVLMYQSNYFCRCLSAFVGYLCQTVYNWLRIEGKLVKLSRVAIKKLCNSSGIHRGVSRPTS